MKYEYAPLTQLGELADVVSELRYIAQMMAKVDAIKGDENRHCVAEVKQYLRCDWESKVAELESAMSSVVDIRDIYDTPKDEEPRPSSWNEDEDGYY